MSRGDIASACIKCAKCIQDCTIYQIHREETHSPRGFLELIHQYHKGNLQFDSTLENIFDSCFLCNHCVSNCPLELPIDNAIAQIREKSKKGFLKRAYFFLLRHRILMDIVFRFIAFVPPCAFKVAKNPLLQLRFAKQSFLQSHKNRQNPCKDSRKVAIFIGCLGNYNYPSTAEALLKILDCLDIEAVIPKQECCGAPAYFSGDIKTSLWLVKKNILHLEAIAQKVEAILIPEATCAAVMLKDWQKILQDEEQWQQRLQKILPKIFMATQWLYHHTQLEKLLNANKKQSLRVTYHDPCHACKVLHITQEPRNLLKQNYRFIELEDGKQCCGFGGIGMQLKHFEIANKVGRKKAHHIKASGADIVSAECSACRVQISYMLKEEKIRFYHPLELIAQALESKI